MDTENYKELFKVLVSDYDDLIEEYKNHPWDIDVSFNDYFKGYITYLDAMKFTDVPDDDDDDDDDDVEDYDE